MAETIAFIIPGHCLDFAGRFVVETGIVILNIRIDNRGCKLINNKICLEEIGRRIPGKQLRRIRLQSRFRINIARPFTFNVSSGDKPDFGAHGAGRFYRIKILIIGRRQTGKNFHAAADLNIAIWITHVAAQAYQTLAGPFVGIIDKSVIRFRQKPFALK